MKHCVALFVLLLAAVPLAQADADSCNGALSALNRVKEEISPKLSAETPAGKAKLQVMASTLERGTRVCRDFGELWYYRMVVAHRLGVEKDATYAKTKVDDLGYTAEFDPFSLPPSAAPPAPSQSPTPGQPRGPTPRPTPTPPPRPPPPPPPNLQHRANRATQPPAQPLVQPLVQPPAHRPEESARNGPSWWASIPSPTRRSLRFTTP